MHFVRCSVIELGLRLCAVPAEPRYSAIDQLGLEVQLGQYNNNTSYLLLSLLDRITKPANSSKPAITNDVFPIKRRSRIPFLPTLHKGGTYSTAQ